VADLANLRISVDSRDVKSATNDLNNLSRASGNAERSANSLTNAAKLFGGALAAVGIFGLATGVAKANAEFQSLNASLKVATGSTAAASAAFDEIRKFAAETPYQLNQTVEAFLKLKNLGLDPSMASLRSYGNTAASMGKSLNQMIEAVADASTLEFERLKEFGIRAKQQKDTVTFTFQNVSTTVKKNSEEIQQYLLNIGNTQFAGAMDEQMKTLNGQMSNLKDNIDNLYVTLGNAGATNIFSQALNAASSAVVYLTTNLNSILRVIEITMVAIAGMAAAFVAFRAALAIQAIVGYIAQTVALNIALGATTTASALAGAGIKGLQAILASSGWGLAVVAIGAVVGVIYSLATAQSRAREETNGHIAALKQLSQTRSAGWAQARTDLEIEKRLLEGQIKVIKERNKAQAVGQGKNIEYVTPDLRAKRERLDAINLGIREADALKAQADAMSKIPAPAAAAAAGIAETGKQAKKAVDPLEKYRDALAEMVEEGKKIGMTPEQIKAFDVEKLAVAAAAAGYKNYNDIRKQGMSNALNQYAIDVAEKMAEKLKEEAKARDVATKAHGETIKALQNEQELIGLTGKARAIAILEQEKEAYILKNQLTMGHTAAAAAAEEYYQIKLKNMNLQGAYDADIAATEKLANNLETVAGMIGGKVGRSLQGILKLEVTLSDGSTKKISDAIAKSFPKLSKALGAATAGAQVGTSVDQLFKSIGIKSSKMGAQAGGAIGGAAFGPVGAIAGSILGGVLGGMLKKTKTGVATISQIAGQGMQTALSGNSAALKDVANTMANGLLKGLGNVAEQLGGTLGGNVKVSLGMRKNDYVVDPTGAGRTKGSGVKNFGTDQAAAVAYITQLAIQQGIVTGISAGAQTLIRAGNDLNEQVQKALKFDQVFKDLKSQSDPLQSSLDELSVEMEKLKVIFGEAGASAADYAKLEELYAIKQAKAIFEANRPRRELEIQLMEAQGDAAGALAAQRALELESMDANLRGLQEQVYTAQDAAKATQALAEAQQKAAEEAAVLAEAALELARDKRALEIDLLEAQGFATDALVARRQLELEAMDETLRGLQEQIWAAEDAKAANEAMNAAAAAAAEVAQAAAELQRNRVELEIQLLEALGKSTEALSARRELELAALDETLRSLQLQIYAAQDAKAASEAAAEAARTMAAEQERLAEQALALSRERRSMEIDLLEAQGFAVEALAARRAVELETIDASLRGLQLQIYAAQDAKAANDAAAEAAKAAAEEQARAAEQILAVAKERRLLEIELLDAQGFAVEALAARRAMELETIDATLVGLKQQIWAAEAKAEADAVAAKAAEEAAKIQEKAAEDAAQAMQKYAETLASVSQTVVDEINRLRGINASSSSVLLKAQFATLTAQARTGNLDALGKLPELSRSIEEATLGSATSALEVARIRAWLSASLTETLGAQAASNAELSTTGAGMVFDGNQTSMASNSADTADGIANMRNEMYNVLYQVAKNTGKSYELMDRWDGDGLPDIREDASDYY
jgi:hypothetical protein